MLYAYSVELVRKLYESFFKATRDHVDFCSFVSFCTGMYNSSRFGQNYDLIYMLEIFSGGIIIILPGLLVVYLLFDWIRAGIRHRKDCDNSTGKQKKLNNLLFKAVVGGNVQKVREAITEGADVNVRGLGGKTPLIRITHRAADSRHYHDKVNLVIAKLLIKKGADVNTKDLFGGSAIEYCDWDLPGFMPQIADFLLKNGARGFPRASSKESGL